MTTPTTYYQLLGIPRSADAKTVRLAFCRLSKALHPDTTTLPPDEATNSFQELCEAYEILSDPIKRKTYDERLEQEFLPHHVDGSNHILHNLSKNLKAQEVRRSFSGGELFSLLLLGVALLLSLFLGTGFALIQGRAWQVRPSWLFFDSSNTQQTISLRSLKNIYAATSKYTIESAFSRGN